MKAKLTVLFSCSITIMSLFLTACSKNVEETQSDLAPMVMINETLYIDTGKTEPMGDSGCISGKITSAVDPAKVPARHEQSNFGCVGNDYVLSEDSIVVFINDDWYRFEKEKKQLTLEQVIELSKKGEELSWNDFEAYESIDIGSGLYIRLYEIDETFNLLIGGGSIEKSPMYIHLGKKENEEEFIDIRTDDVKEFISKFEK